MGIGGFSNDPTPTLAQFQKYVADKAIGYYVVTGQRETAHTALDGSSNAIGEFASGQHTGRSTGSVATTIAAWVAHHYSARTVGGYTVYDLNAPIGAAKTEPSSTTTAAQQSSGSAQSEEHTGAHRGNHHLARS